MMSGVVVGCDRVFWRGTAMAEMVNAVTNSWTGEGWVKTALPDTEDRLEDTEAALTKAQR
jgi:hypothetical protein